MKKRIFFLSVILILPTIIFAQEKSGDIKEAENLNRQTGKLYALGDYDHALIAAKRELSLRKTIGDEKYIAAVLFNIGGIYEQKKNLSKAIEYFELALRHYRQAYGSKHSKVYKVLQQLAVVHLRKRQKRKALKYMDDAKLVAESLYGKDSADIAKFLLTQARIYFTMGRRNDVDRVYREAIFINDKVLNSSALDIRSDVDGYMCFVIYVYNTGFVPRWNKFQRERFKKGYRALPKGTSIAEEIKIGVPNVYWSSDSSSQTRIVPIRVRVNLNGDVESAQSLCGELYRVKKAAKKAALESKFKPARRDGVPVMSTRLIYFAIRS